MAFLLNQSLSTSQLQQWDAFLRRTACDMEEVLSVGLDEATVSLGEVGADGYARAVELIC